MNRLQNENVGISLGRRAIQAFRPARRTTSSSERLRTTFQELRWGCVAVQWSTAELLNSSRLTALLPRKKVWEKCWKEGPSRLPLHSKRGGAVGKRRISWRPGQPDGLGWPVRGQQTRTHQANRTPLPARERAQTEVFLWRGKNIWRTVTHFSTTKIPGVWETRRNGRLCSVRLRKEEMAFHVGRQTQWTGRPRPGEWGLINCRRFKTRVMKGRTRRRGRVDHPSRQTQRMGRPHPGEWGLINCRRCKNRVMKGMKRRRGRVDLQTTRQWPRMPSSPRQSATRKSQRWAALGQFFLQAFFCQVPTKTTGAILMRCSLCYFLVSDECLSTSPKLEWSGFGE